VAATKQPLFDAARILLGQGADPSVLLVLRHSDSHADALKARIGTAAKLTVEESNFGPVFRSFRTAPATPGDRAPIEKTGRGRHCAP
jgi:hypothetical protein